MTKYYEYAAPVGRVLIAILFLIAGFQKLGDIAGNAAYITSGGLPGWLIYPTILVEIGGAILVAIGYQARLAALVLAGFTLLAGLLYHLIPAGAAEGMAAQMQMLMFYKNLAIAGGLLMIVSMGAGAYSVEGRKAA